MMETDNLPNHLLNNFDNSQDSTSSSDEGESKPLLSFEYLPNSESIDPLPSDIPSVFKSLASEPIQAKLGQVASVQPDLINLTSDSSTHSKMMFGKSDSTIDNLPLTVTSKHPNLLDESNIESQQNQQISNDLKPEVSNKELPSQPKSDININPFDIMEHKTNLIKQAVKRKDRSQLRILARSSLGLINNTLRNDAWCILLHTDKNTQKKSLVSDRDFDKQIEKDCTQAFVDFPSLSSEKKVRKQKELSELLKAIFRREPQLHYYKGFRDVASCVLLVLSKRKVANALQNIALFYLRDNLLETLSPTMRELALGFSVIKIKDPELHEFLVKSQVQSYYGLSYILSWFSNAVNSHHANARLLDAFIASDSIFPIYLLSALTLSRGEELVKLNCEKSSVQSYFATLQLDKNIEPLLEQAYLLYEDFPPAALQNQSSMQLNPSTCSQRFQADWNSISTIKHYALSYDRVQDVIKQFHESRNIPEVKCVNGVCEIPTEASTKGSIFKLAYLKNLLPHTVTVLGILIGLYMIFLAHSTTPSPPTSQ